MTVRPSVGAWRIVTGLVNARLFTLVVLAALILVAPAFISPAPQEVLRFRSLLVVFGSLVLGLLLFIFLGREGRRAHSPPARTLWEFIRTGPNVPVLLFLAWSWLAFRNSAFWPFGLPVLLGTAAGAAVYFVVAYHLACRIDLRWVVRFIGGAVIVSVAARLVARLIQGSAPAVVSFGNTQFDGAFLGLTFLLLATVASAEHDARWRLFMQLAALAAGAGLLLTGCRSAWHGVAAGGIFLGIYAVSRRRRGGARSSRALHPALFATAGIVLLAVLLLTVGGWSRIATRASSLTALGSDDSLRWRVRMARAAGRMIAADPWTGWGLGAFPVFAGHFINGSRAPAEVLSRGATLSELPHNEYLQLGAETGIPGLALYLMILAAFFTYCGRGLRRQESRYLRALAVGCIAATVAQSVDALGNPAWRFPEISLFYWLTLGLGVGAVRARPDASRVTRHASVDMRYALARVSAAALGAFLILGFGSQVMAAVNGGGRLAGEAQTQYADGSGPDFGGSRAVILPVSRSGQVAAGGGQTSIAGAQRPGLEFHVGAAGEFTFELVGIRHGKPSPCCCCELTEKAARDTVGSAPAGHSCCGRCRGTRDSGSGAAARSALRPDQWCRQVEDAAARGGAPAQLLSGQPAGAQVGRGFPAAPIVTEPAPQRCGCGQRIALDHATPLEAPRSPPHRTTIAAREDTRPPIPAARQACCPPAQTYASPDPLRCARILDLQLRATDAAVEPGEKSGLRLFARIDQPPGWYDVTSHPAARYEIVGLAESAADTKPDAARYSVDRSRSLQATGGAHSAGGPFEVRAGFYCHRSAVAVTSRAP